MMILYSYTDQGRRVVFFLHLPSHPKHDSREKKFNNYKMENSESVEDAVKADAAVVLQIFLVPIG